MAKVKPQNTEMRNAQVGKENDISPQDFAQYDFGFENLAFEGGGVKMMAHIGVLQVNINNNSNNISNNSSKNSSNNSSKNSSNNSSNNSSKNSNNSSKNSSNNGSK